jgi:HEAT repeat protein
VLLVLLTQPPLKSQDVQLGPDGLQPASATLGKLVQATPLIAAYRVETVSPDGTTIAYQKTVDLKGVKSPATLQHHFKNLPETDSPYLKRLHKGDVAVVFTDKLELVCLGEFWYWCDKEDARDWQAKRLVQGLEQTYCGPAQPLPGHIRAVLAGQEVVITAAAPPPQFEGHYSPSRMPFQLPGGKAPRWRIKASLKIQELDALIERSPYFVGWGLGGQEVVPTLVERLKSPDSKLRADAAQDLGQLQPAPAGTVAPLRLALRDADVFVRVCAAHSLATVAPDDTEAVPMLLRTLDEKDPNNRLAALVALGAYGGRAAPAVPKLLQLWKAKQEPSEALLALIALGEIAPGIGGPNSASAQVVAALNEAIVKQRAMPSEDEDITYLMLQILRRFGPDARAAFPALKACLDGHGELEVEPAGLLLVRFGSGGVAVFDEYLRGDKPRHDDSILLVLREMGPCARVALPTVLGYLKDEDLSTRLAAAQTLAHLDRRLAARLVGPILVESLKNRAKLAMEGPREDAIFPTIAELGPQAREVVPALTAYLQDDSMMNRPWAAELLGRIGPAAREALPALRAYFNEHSDRFSPPQGAGEVAAALVIWRISRDPAAINLLTDTIKRFPGYGRALKPEDSSNWEGKDPYGLWFPPKSIDGPSSLAAYDALLEFGTPARAALAKLLADLKADPADLVRQALAAGALAQLDRRYRLPADQSQAEAVALLARLWQSGDVLDQRTAARQVAHPGLQTAAAVPYLVKGLDSPDLFYRAQCLRTLSALGPTAQASAGPLARLLARALATPDDALAVLTAQTLWRVEPGNAQVLPALREVLAKHPDVGMPLYEALAALGPAARPAVSALTRLVRRGDWFLCEPALKALRRIDPEAAERAWPVQEAVDTPFPPQKLSSQELEAAWTSLASLREPEANRAAWVLALSPRSAVPFLADRLQPAPTVPAEQIDRWIADLESKNFADRKAATEGLEKAGDAAEAGLKKALKKGPSLDVRRRLEKLLDNNDPKKASPCRRTLRAVESLQWCATPEALVVLNKLASGDPNARLTRAARTALEGKTKR